MGRTAKTTLKLRNAGTPLTSGSFDTLDFTSGITAVDSGNGVAGVSAAGSSGTNISTQAVTAVASGANITLDLTTLSHTFVAVEIVFRNGQQVSATRWSLSSSTITVFNADPSEEFTVQYTW